SACASAFGLCICVWSVHLRLVCASAFYLRICVCLGICVPVNFGGLSAVSPGVRHAFRRLVASPAFSLTALVTLGVAIGANALIFSVVNGVLLKPLPFADPDRLVGVWHLAPGILDGDLNQSPATYLTYRDAGVFQDIGMWDNAAATVTGRGD